MSTDNIANAIANIGSDITHQLGYIGKHISTNSSNLDEITSSLQNIGTTLTQIRQELVVLSVPEGRRDAQREYFKLEARIEVYESMVKYNADDEESQKFWQKSVDETDGEIKTLLAENRIV
jgi:hypothetical protein